MSSIGRDLDDARMIGIWGLGGSGKTTVARVVFDEISKQFGGASFIDNVREEASHKSGLPLLQAKILRDIFMEKDLKLVSSVHHGIQMMKTRLRSQKVLIVLDDVDHVEQLRALAGASSWFGNGSRIIITTRDKQPLEAHGIEEIYSLDLLTKDEAIKLFNRYAFKKSNPTKRHNELSLYVVRYAAGLPLALKVLGSFLCDRGIDEWSSALERLKKVPNKDILEVLKVSYDGLGETEKELFLDIACLFKGWHTIAAFEILDSCGFDPGIGIHVLVDKSLITISEGSFQMHDLIQEMGRKISQIEPGKHSRPWQLEDIRNALEKNMGTEALEALVINQYELRSVIEEAKEMVIPELGYKRIQQQIHVFECDAEAFRSMKKLRVFNYSCPIPVRDHTCVISCDRIDFLSNELRWLNWDCYIHESLPECFQALKLVLLRMNNSCIVQLWKEMKCFKELKVLDLRGSAKLISCPDFSGMPKLEELFLSWCSSLVAIHPSIGYLQRLVSLDLNHCRNLMDLPDTICMSKSLRMMDLSSCRSLIKLPENLGHIVSLKELMVDSTSFRQLPSSIMLSKNLERLSLCWSKILDDSLQPLFQSSCLKVLDLSHQRSKTAIPIEISNLSSLEELYLCSNEFSFLPSSISQLSCLKILNLSNCDELKALPELPPNIAVLMAMNCISSENFDVLLDRNYEWLWNVSIRGNYNLQKLPNFGDSLLRNMLQGNAVVNHLISIQYHKGDGAMPMWFREGVVEEAGNHVFLVLPPNWQNEIAGFALCCVGLYRWITLEITLSVPPSLPEDPDIVGNGCDVWVGYISLNMLRRSYEGVMPANWMDAAPELCLTFKGIRGKATACGARLVFKKDVPSKVAFVSSYPRRKDPNFAAETTIKCSHPSDDISRLLINVI